MRNEVCVDLGLHGKLKTHVKNSCNNRPEIYYENVRKLILFIKILLLIFLNKRLNNKLKLSEDYSGLYNVCQSLNYWS